MEKHSYNYRQINIMELNSQMQQLRYIVENLGAYQLYFIVM